jgi:hypothetical protein
MESFMICTGPQYYVFGLMKGDEMEMGIWGVWCWERGKQDFGGDRVGKRQLGIYRLRWDDDIEVVFEKKMH